MSLPDRRRRRALERGPRLRAAPADAAGDRAGPADRDRGALPAPLRRRRARADGRPPTPSCTSSADTIEMWLRTRGGGVRPHARAGHAAARRRASRAPATAGEEGIGADQAFLLHDTYGFPFDLTLELAAEQGLGVDEQGFEELMDEQRARARASAGRGARDDERERIRAFAERRGLPDHVHRLRADRAGDRGRRRRRARTAACCSSSSSRRSTRPAAARSPTPASSSARTATAARAWSTSCGSATTRRSCSSPSTASCTRASA